MSYARVVPSPYAYQGARNVGFRGLGGGFSFSASASAGDLNQTQPGRLVGGFINDVAANIGASGGGGGGSAGSSGGRTTFTPKPPPPPPVRCTEPAFGSGQYPGIDNASSELRIYGTVGGGLPRGYRDAQEATDYVHCINMQIPRGLPCQTKSARAASLAGPAAKCTRAMMAAREGKMLPGIPPGMYPGVDAVSTELRTRGTVGGAAPRGRSAAFEVAFFQCMNQKFPGGLPAQSTAARKAATASAAQSCTYAAAQAMGGKVSPATLKISPLLLGIGVPPKVGDVPGALPDPNAQPVVDDTILGITKTYAIAGAVLLAAGGAYLYSRKS